MSEAHRAGMGGEGLSACSLRWRWVPELSQMDETAGECCKSEWGVAATAALQW